jgi:predicted amidohydrolase
MFKIGFAQFSPVREAVAANIAAVARLLYGVQADLLVLPELANSGYLYAAPVDLVPYAEPGDGSGPFLAALRGLAGQTRGVIVAGFAEQAAEGLYNSAAAVGPDGVIQVYRKTHLFAGEKLLFLPGNTGFRVFEHPGVGACIGLMVCFDWYFPESARTLALRGAQIIAHPSNLVLPHCQTAMVTRCLENRVYAVTTNRFGTETLPETSLTFTGASQIMSPRGERLAQAPVAGEYVAVVEIDPGAADNKWVTPRNDLFADRRPELYG